MQTIVITPECCEEAQKYAPVFLFTRGLDCNKNKNMKPKWVTNVNIELKREGIYFDEISGLPNANFCPFCGTKVPEIKQKELNGTEKFIEVTDGGYYCDTCEERLDSCECLHTEKAWEIIK